MNKIYKVVWSKAKNAYVVVSELAKNSTKGCSTKKLLTMLIATGVMSAGVLMGGTLTAEANVVISDHQQHVFTGSNNILATNNADNPASASDTGIAIGEGASADAEYSITLGNGTVVNSTSKNSVAIGSSAAYTSGSNSFTAKQSKVTGSTNSLAMMGAQITGPNDGSGLNIGIGANTTIDGVARVTAIGAENKISDGSYSASVIGQSNTVTKAHSSVVMGVGNNVSKNEAIAIGRNTEVSGEYGTAVGYYAKASGIQSIAIGSAERKTNHYDYVEDTQTVASGLQSIALGTGAEALAKSSIAQGSGASTGGLYSIAIGNGATIENNTGDLTNNRDGLNAIAVGNGATIKGVWTQNSIAVGRFIGADANGSYDIAATVTDADNTIVIGGSTVTGNGQKYKDEEHDVVDSNIALGNKNTITKTVYSDAIGYGNEIKEGATSSVALGVLNQVGDGTIKYTGKTSGGDTIEQGSGYFAAVMGNSNKVTGTYDTAVGQSNQVNSSRNAVAIGVSNIVGNDKKYNETQYQGDQGTAVGNGNKVYGLNNTAIGSGNTAGTDTDDQKGGSYNFAAGNNSKATDTSDIAIGNNAEATASTATAIGQGSRATNIYSNAIGKSANASGYAGVALGSNATAGGDRSVAIGGSSNSESSSYDTGATKAEGANSVALGLTARTGSSATDAVAIGHSSSATGAQSIAIGKEAVASGSQSISIGTGNTVSGNNSGAIGDPSVINGDNSYSVGNNNTIGADADNTFVLGNSVEAKVGNSVYLGDDSTAVSAAGKNLYKDGTTDDNATTTGGATGKVDSATVGNLTYVGFAGETAVGAVTVGASGAERRIQNVAAGEISATSTDAINGSQLYSSVKAVQTHFYSVNNSTTTAGNYNNDGATAADALAAGVDASAAGVESIAIGKGASVANSVVAGGAEENYTSGYRATAIGNASISGAWTLGSTAIGDGATITGADNSLVIGSSSITGTGTNVLDRNIAIGEGNTVTNASTSSAIGADNKIASGVTSGLAWGKGNTIGDGTTTVKNESGTYELASGTQSLAAGIDNTIYGAQDTVVGQYNETYGYNQTAIGFDNTVGVLKTDGTFDSTQAGNSTAVGYQNTVTGKDSAALGNSNEASGSNSFALGSDSHATASNTVAIGNYARATSQEATAIGRQASASSASAIAMGTSANASENAAIALGANSVANKANSTAIGNTAKAEAERAMALGTLTNATANDSVALGSYSAATRTADVTKGVISSLSDKYNNAIDDTFGEVNIGKQTKNIDGTVTYQDRVLGGVATGSADDDAVNVRQWKSTTLVTGADSGSAKTTLFDETLNIVGDGKYISTAATDGGTTNQIKISLDENKLPTLVNGKNTTVSSATNSTTGRLEYKVDAYDTVLVAGTNVSLDGSTTDEQTGVRTYKINVDVPAGVNTVTAVTSEGKDVPTASDTVGDYGDYNGGSNIKVRVKEDDKGNPTYDIKLADTLNIGEKGEAGQDGQPGKDGVDGKIGVNGKDGSAVVINGKDGSIGLTGPKGEDGKDGASATIKVIDGTPGLAGNDGENGESKTRIEYVKPDGTTEEIATLNDGLKFVGDDGTVTPIAKKLNETLQIIGDGTATTNTKEDGSKVTTVEGGNIQTSVDKETGAIKVALNHNVDLTQDGSLTIGGKTIENEEDGTKTTYGPITIKQGDVSFGGNVIHNVAPGVEGTDAVNVDQLNTTVEGAKTEVTSTGGTIKVTPSTDQDDNHPIYNVEVSTTTLSAEAAESENAGKVTAGENASTSYATAESVANAINNSGFNVTSGGNTTVEATKELVNPGDTVTLNAGTNLTVTQSGSEFTYALSDEIGLTQDGSITIGAKTIENEEDGTKTTYGPITIKQGDVSFGGNVIHNVAPGVEGTDAVNVDQLNTTVAGAKTEVTVNGGTPAPTEVDKYTEEGNLLLSHKIGTNGQTIYDLKLNDKLELGKGNNQVTVDGTKGQVIAGGVTVGQQGDDAGNYVTGLDNKTWEVGKTEAVSGRAATEDQLKHVSDKVKETGDKINEGLNFAADSGEPVNKKLGDTLTIKGDSTTITDEESGEPKQVPGNIKTSVDTDGAIKIELEKDITVDSVTAGTEEKGSKMTEDGLTVKDGDKSTNIGAGTITVTGEGSEGVDGPTITIDGNSGTISGLTNTEWDSDNIAQYEGSNKAATEAQLHDAVGDLKQDITDLDTKIDSKMDGFNVTGNDKAETKTAIGNNNTVNFNDSDNIKTTVTAKEDGTGVDVSFDLGNTINIGEKGEKGDDGKPGVDGKIGVNGADGSAVVINGKDGSIGMNGADGKNGLTIKGDQGPAGVDGKDGETKTRIVYTPTDGDPETIATLNDGMKFVGDDGTVVTKKLNETLDIVGGATGNATEKDNIKVTNNDGKLKVQLAENLDLGDNGSVKMGDTTINNGGITTGGNTFSSTEVKVSEGTKVDMGGNKIENVAAGEADTDAVNVGQLKQATDGINQNAQNLNKLSNRVNKGLAGAAALAALHPLDFDPDDKLTFAAGIGNYKGENAGAIGMFYRPDEKVMFSLGATVGNDDNMVNAGVSFSLDRTARVTNTKTAMAKHILELEDKVDKLTNLLVQVVENKADVSQSAEYQEVANLMFPDVPENHWAYDYVDNLMKVGIIEGYPNGLFGGERSCTRYEFAAMLYRALLAGDKLNQRLLDEFGPELEKMRSDMRFRVDRVHGKDNDKRKVERIRTNGDKYDEDGNRIERRDHYGSRMDLEDVQETAEN